MKWLQSWSTCGASRFDDRPSVLLRPRVARRFSIHFAAVFLCLLIWTVLGAHGYGQSVDRLQHGITVGDLKGKIHRIHWNDTDKIRVFVFLSTDCPVARSYIPTLNSLQDRWQVAGRVALYGVLSDQHHTRKQTAAFAEEFAISFPVLFDAAGEMADWLAPTHVPEAFVVNGQGQVAYRGRIDDVYAELGKRRLEPTRHDLRNAVDSLLTGRLVKETRTQPVGCLFETRSSDDKAGAVTFNRHIAPIVFSHCTTCHREGEVAPFPLATFDDVSRRVGQVVQVTRSRLMPPWRPDDPPGHFVGDRRLSPRELELLAAWADAGAPEGNPDDLPPLPEFVDGWQLGEPDLIVQMPTEFRVPADGPDIFQNFVVPLNNAQDMYCIAAEFRPGNKAVVHHSLLYLDHHGQARKRDENDPQPGYSTFGGPGFVPTGSVGGWSPGTSGLRLPDQFARYVKTGSDLVIQIHYHPTGKVETDRSVVGLHFIEKPKNIVAGLALGNVTFTIPAGERDHRVTASYQLPQDVTLVGVTPHMHLLGRSMKAWATLPDGSKRPLISIPDWHFYWQDQYVLANQIRLPKGTQLEVEARYDNSTDNPFNPSTPPQEVGYGEGTTDEMCYCFFLVATDDPSDLRPLINDNFRRLVRARVVDGFKASFDRLKTQLKTVSDGG